MRSDNREVKPWLTLMQVFAVALLTINTVAADTNYVVGIDRNYFVRAIDWVDTGPETRVLVLTYPSTDQPHIREGCTVNFYSLALRPGLESMQLVPLVENYCGHRLEESGRLLANGDAVLLMDDRVETFRPGTGRIAGWSLAEVPELQRYPSAITHDIRTIDVYPDGSVVFASGFPRARGDIETPSAVVAGLSQTGDLQWEYIFDERGVQLAPMDIWATADGGALLHVRASPMRGAGMPDGVAPAGMPDSEHRLYRMSASGRVSEPVVIAETRISTAPVELPDITVDPEGYRAALNAAVNASVYNSYSAGQLVGHARPDGSIDLLLGRGTKEVRVVRIDPEGRAVLDEVLTEDIQTEQHRRWQDGFITGDVLTIFGTLGLKETRLPQGYASSLDLGSKQLSTKLAPLEGPGLEAAINARDAERRFLEHDPSQQPQLIARLAANPLLVSVIHRNRKQALQITEVDDTLQSYPPVKETSAAVLPNSSTVDPARAFTECDCSCETLSSMKLRSDYLKAESKTTGQPPPIDELMLMSQCFIRCQQNMMACMQQR